MTLHGIGSSGRISGPYLRALRGRKRGPLPEPDRHPSLPGALSLRTALVVALALLAAVVWSLR
jgi:hypothetical protein